MSSHFCQLITIPCSAGNIEGRLSYREENMGRAGVVICPPHPLLAGNMDNNVIVALADRLACNFPVISFNYRAVGRSFKTEPGLPLFEYWQRLDQGNDFSEIISDVAEIIAWSSCYFIEFHLVGYSFGSFVALAALPEAALSFSGITPPLTKHDFGKLSRLACRSLLVFAENDKLLPGETTGLPAQVEIREIADSDHFFIKREHELAAIVESFLLAD